MIAGSLEGAPHETLLVVDATTGQNGVQQARLFAEAAGVTGVALTKLDGSAKGGVAIAIAHELGLPVKLVGVGGVDDLRPFDARDYARALVGGEERRRGESPGLGGHCRCCEYPRGYCDPRSSDYAALTGKSRRRRLRMAVAVIAPGIRI